MRKFLSMMLAVALVLTTLAIPMSAFAADPVMTVTYAIDTVNGDTPGAEIYPGDEVVVSVSLTAVTDTITLTDLEFINTVANDLDGTWAAADGITNSSSTEADEDILVSDSTISVTTAGTKIMTGTFTMPAATADYTVTAEGFTAYGNNVQYDTEIEENVTITPLTISVVQPENVIKVGDSVLSTDAVPTIYASTAKITWTSESTKATAEYSLDSAEAVTIPADGIEVSTAGTYEVTVKYGNGLTYTCSFKLSTESVDGTISTTISDDGKALKYGIGDTFTVPVVLTGGSSEDIVGGVAFTVDYDAAVLSMAKGDADTNVVIEDNKVTYTAATTSGEPNDLLSKDEAVATLTFTVLEGAAYGNTEIKFAGVGIAIEGSLEQTNASLGVTQESTTILVMPATPLAAITDGDLKTSWVNEAYDVSVTVTEPATAKLYVADAITDNGDQADYKTWYDTATVTVTNSITINSYQDYAIVTKLGDTPAEYQVVLITADETKFDNTKPEVTPGAGMSDWLRTDASAQTIAISTFATVADAIPADGAITAEYYIGEVADPIAWTESTDGNIDIPKDSEDTKVTIKWTDEAGNETEAKTYELKLDATAPVITVTETTGVVEGKKTVKFTVTETGSGIDTVKVYTSNAGDITVENPGTEVPPTLAENVYSFDVTETTWYSITASDKAGIEAKAENGKVEFAAATATTQLTAQVVKGDSQPTLIFYDTVTMAAKSILTREKTAHTGNGTFTYAKLTMPAAQEGITTTISVTKGGEAYTTETYEFTEVGEYVITVVNSDTSEGREETTFQFSIVAAENIMTVNGNSVYDVADYGRVRDLVSVSKTAPESGALFYGGYYSGDLNGDGSYTDADYSELITNLRARIKEPANSNYPILNKEAAE